MKKNSFSLLLYQEGRLLERWDGLELEMASRIYRQYFRDADYGVMVYRGGERLKCPEAWRIMGVSCGRCLPKKIGDGRGRPQKLSEVLA